LYLLISVSGSLENHKTYSLSGLLQFSNVTLVARLSMASQIYVSPCPFPGEAPSILGVILVYLLLAS
jgi:hypothetical protein